MRVRGVSEIQEEKMGDWSRSSFAEFVIDTGTMRKWKFFHFSLLIVEETISSAAVGTRK
jgi:hypothetical protein